MRRYRSLNVGYSRFGISHPHKLNNSIGFRGGIRL
ncbi:hypothetical protein [Sigmofec virus UA08Rod_5838]|uniref:Uncharacterized protein n=1 Tax=Sigmofec virus UA08Rod_5838 TaxID=2929442 RepID=A0A976R6V9_9VIRU|nr:hypothetical protein [Sigmofec virus UA08Rod_5838]